MAGAKPIVCAALALALASGAWARGASHGSSGHRSSHSGFHHHRHGHAVFFGGFFFGAPFWRPYYYGPDFAARSEPPNVYVERFEGQPTPGTQGEIFCPDEGKYYPAVTQCPGGWQRVIRPEG